MVGVAPQTTVVALVGNVAKAQSALLTANRGSGWVEAWNKVRMSLWLADGSNRMGMTL